MDLFDWFFHPARKGKYYLSFLKYLSRRKARKSLRQLPRIERGKARFAQAYADCGYEYGYASYGLPRVHDWSEGASLKIGKYCSIAEDVDIFLGGNHRPDWVSTFPFPAFSAQHGNIEGYAISRGDVVIGNDVWLCTGAKILSGVTIGNGAVVGAYAVVSRDVEPYSIVAGNPAKVVRYRFSEEERLQLEQIAWWNWDEAAIQEAIPLLCSENLQQFFALSKTKQANYNACLL